MDTNTAANPRSRKELLLMLGLLILVALVSILSIYLGQYILLLPLLFFLCFLIISKPLLFLKIFFIFGPLIWTFSDALYIPVRNLRINTPIMIGGLIVLFYIRFMFYPIADNRIRPIRNLSLMVFVFAFPAALWSTTIFDGLGEYIRIISPFIILFSIFHLAKRKEQILSVMNIMGFVALSTFMTLLMGMVRGDLYSETGYFMRISGSGLMFQSFAKFAAVNIIILFILMTLRKKKNNSLLFVAASLLIIILLLTYHRTSWIILIVAIFMGVVLFSRVKTYKFLIAGFILGLIAFGAEIYRLFIRYASSFNLEEIERISSGRTVIWQIYFSNYLQSSLLKILFGMGYGDPDGLTIARLGRYYWPHNDFLAVLVETGIISLIIHLFFLFSLMYLAISVRNSKRDSLTYNFSRHTIILIAILLLTGLLGAFYGNIMSGWYVYAIFGLFLASVMLDKPIYQQDAEKQNS